MPKKPTYEELEQRIKELEAEKDKFHTVLDSVAIGIDVVSYDYKVQSQNKLLRDRFGDIREKLCYKEYMNSDRPCSDCPMRRAVENNTVERAEFIGADGRDYELISTPLRNPDGSMSAVGVAIDITDRKRVEQALKESEQKYLGIFENIQDVYYEVTIDGIILELSPSIENVSQYKREELIGKSLYEIYADPKKRDEFVTNLQNKGRVTDYEIILKDKDGSQGCCSITAILITDRQGRPAKIVGSLRNITERKRAEEEIRTLGRQLLKAQENERQRISRELHDGVGQDLCMLKIGFHTLFDGQPEVLPRIRQRVSELSNIFQGCIKAIQNLAYDLRPFSLDQLGLVETIFQYCNDFSEKTGLNIDFSSAGMDDIRLDFDTEINLYRLVQESLNNVRKHADARNVKVRLVSSFVSIILRIEDDGKGFDAKKQFRTTGNKKQMGLRSMQERVSLLGGTIAIQSRPMHGTRISIEVPCKRKNSGQGENR